MLSVKGSEYLKWTIKKDSTKKFSLFCKRSSSDAKLLYDRAMFFMHFLMFLLIKSLG